MWHSSSLINNRYPKYLKSITLVPLGGLCNRLRAIFSAMMLARDCQVPLCVVWLRDCGLNARFSDLFETVYSSSIKIIDSRDWSRYGVARRRNLYLPLLKQRFIYDTILTEADLIPLVCEIPLEQMPTVIRSRLVGNVFIQTGLSFYPSDDCSLLSFFKPLPVIRNLIEARRKQITSHTVGLHIRRTDNHLSTIYSPLSAFIEAMEKDIQRDSQTNFYVASDDPSIASTLALQFPNCNWNDDAPTRNAISGMQSAVAELFTLIDCPRFHGSYWSSFSDMVVACHKEGLADIISVQKSI